MASFNFLQKKIFAFFALFFPIFLCAPLVFAQAPAALKGSVTAGKYKASACMGCHGISGYKVAYPEVYHAPMLGGQSQKYLENALTDYQSGKRKHPSMQSNAQALSPQDIADIAAYYAEGGEKTAKVSGIFFQVSQERVQKGKAAAEKFACASCHGADFQTPTDPGYPKLAGQPADYLAQALFSYQRPPEQMGARNHAIMRPLAAQLSQEDIHNIAAFLQSLPTLLTVKK